MKIICIGRNYIEHAKELNSPLPEKPVFFLKPETSLVRDNGPFPYPAFSKEVHYEAEIVLHIDKGGKDISEKEALGYIDSIGLGFDFTARDLQKECKSKGLPWEISKAFDGSAPVSNEFINKNEFPDLRNIDFRLDLNGRTVQNGNSADMIFPFERVVSYVSQFIT
jgi:acylpyruvate hydrolase